MRLRNLPSGSMGFVSNGDIQENDKGRFEISGYAVCQPAPITIFTVPIMAYDEPTYDSFEPTERVFFVEGRRVYLRDEWWIDHLPEIVLSLLAAAVLLIIYTCKD